MNRGFLALLVARIVPALPATLAICATFGCAPASAPEPPEPSAHPFTIATYNVHFPGWNDAATVEAIGHSNADVIFLQEISPRWQAALEGRYRKVYPHMLFAAGRGASGLGVLSRFPLHDEKFLPPVFNHPAWVVRVETPAGELHVLNVHLRASTRPGQNVFAGLITMACDHVTEIRSFFEASPAPPTLVVGDFNEGPDGSAIKWLESQGFVDALERHSPRQATFRAKQVAGLLRSTLDHILFRGQPAVLDAWVLHSGNSDHLPVLARF